MHALARARLQPGEQVVVFGAGPIGLATLVAAVSRGARVWALSGGPPGAMWPSAWVPKP